MKIRVRKVSFKPEYEELSSYLLTDKYVDFHEKIIFKLPTSLESYI